MSSIIKKIVLALMMAIICVSFISCSNNEVSLKSLKTDDIFQYADAKWGVSPDEANKTLSLPIVKDDARTPSDSRYVTYKMEKKIKIKVYDVFATFEFADDKLRQIMFYVYSEKDDYQKCFDTLSAELEELYGEGKNVKGARGNRNIFWLLENTKLDISEVVISQEPCVLISVSDMSQFPDISIDNLYDIFNQEGVYEVEPAENSSAK